MASGAEMEGLVSCPCATTGVPGGTAPVNHPGPHRRRRPDLFATQAIRCGECRRRGARCGISRRTLFRYYPSKSAIPWGDFDSHLRELERLLAEVPAAEPMKTALRAALLAFNTFEGSGPSAPAPDASSWKPLNHKPIR